MRITFSASGAPRYSLADSDAGEGHKTSMVFCTIWVPGIVGVGFPALEVGVGVLGSAPHHRVVGVKRSTQC